MVTPLKILVVEDHDLLRQTMVSMLCQRGHDAHGVFGAEDVDTFHTTDTPDVYIVDVMLPNESGLSLARRLRRARPNAGIVIVSARGELEDRLSGYQAGVDVYLCKPFEADELLAVIGSIAQRIGASSLTSAFSLDSERLSLTGPGGTVLLTRSEVSLLMGFLSTSDHTLDLAKVAAHFRLGLEAPGRTTLNVRLSQMRKKLGNAGAQEPMVRAIRGKGYKLCLPIAMALGGASPATVATTA